MSSLREYHIYSWGANSYGQLGQNHQDDVLTVSQRVGYFQIKDLQINKIIKATGGGDGKLFTCGQNNRGQLGLGSTIDFSYFQPLESLKDIHINDVACGWEHSLALTDSGEVFAWGSNSHCQLGLESKQPQCTPHRISNFQCRVKSIAAGLYHSAAVDENGNVYTWGNGKKGQLGITDENGKPLVSASTPQLALEDKQVKWVICGSHHTAVLLVTGEIMMWGCTKYGQISDPTLYKIIPLPMLIQGLEKISKIYSGWTHMIAQTDEGKLLTWGRNNYGQLGRKAQNSSHLPGQINLQSKISQVAVGAEHNLAVTGTSRLNTIYGYQADPMVILHKNEVLAWGWNEHGMCGNGTEEPVPEPLIVKDLTNFEAYVIGCAAGASFAIGEETIMDR